MPTTRIYLPRSAGRKTESGCRPPQQQQQLFHHHRPQLPLPTKPLWTFPLVWMTAVFQTFSSVQINPEKHLLIMAFVRCSAPLLPSSRKWSGLSLWARPVAPPPSKPNSSTRRWFADGRWSRAGGLGEGWPGCTIGSTLLGRELNALAILD